MSPWHTCKRCNSYVIGEKRYGCMMCNRIEASKKIKTKIYAKSLLGLQIPIELIIIISCIAANNYDYDKLIKINTDCWKARMHCIIP